MEPIQFQSAKHKLKRANQHIKELDLFLKKFFNTQAFFTVSGVKIDDSYVLQVETGGDKLPPDVSLILGDAIHNIRTAYDHAVVTFTGEQNNLAMPIGKLPTDVKNSTYYKHIETNFPDFAKYILDKLQPYEGGDLLLWEITKLDNWDKHNLLIPTISISKVTEIAATAANGSIMSGITVVLNHGQSVSPIKMASPITITNKGTAWVALLFSDPVLQGNMIVPTLTNCVKGAFEALNALELFCYGKVSDPNTLE